ncbi:MAG TPA: SDR family oxidoreductase [Rubrobacter sp.]
MRLVIFGATGGTGRRLVERAIAEGHEVTAFARNPSRMTARHERLNVVVGDAFDPGQVLEAVAGNEAVISVLGSRQPSNPLRPRSPGDPDGPASAGSRNIIAAMKEHGLRRFVCQTAWGVGESKHDPGLAGAFFMKVLVPPLLRDEYADKEAQERTVRESDLGWIIVRPMILTNGPWTNDYRAGEDLKPGRRPYISRADVADFLMRQLTDDTFVRKTPAIGY